MFLDDRVKGFVNNKFYRRELISNVCFDLSAVLCEDFLWNYTILLNAKDGRTAYISKPFYNYVFHENSATKNIQKQFSQKGELLYIKPFEIMMEMSVNKPLLLNLCKGELFFFSIQNVYRAKTQIVIHDHIKKKLLMYLLKYYKNYCYVHNDLFMLAKLYFHRFKAIIQLLLLYLPGNTDKNKGRL